MPDAFFEIDGETIVPTELTRGPWDSNSQHAGPPAALVGREIEQLEGGGQVGRVTYEILRAVPIAPLTVSARIVRPGRRVELIEASLADEQGEVMRAHAWRLRPAPVEVPAELIPEDAPPGPDAADPTTSFFETGHSVGYHTAMEYRFVTGSFVEPGPATVWMRMRHPLLSGEEPSPLQRVLIAADSGNGISATLDYRRYLFINVDLSVHLHRMPEGDWVCLDAVTIPQPTGVGMSDTVLYDERGPIGRAAQTLLVAERG